MTENRPAGFHLAATWLRRVGTLLGAASLLLLAAVGLGVGVQLIALIFEEITYASHISWILLGDLVLTVISGLVTVYSARSAARLLGRAFAVLPAVHGGLPAGAVESTRQ